jgi:hypothetical protein
VHDRHAGAGADLPGRAGSYTSVGAAGGALNPATGQPVNQALYTMPYSWFQIELETSALVQTGSNAQSVIAAKDLEIQGAVENTRHQISRQIVTNGDGIVAACGATTTGTTIPLSRRRRRAPRTATRRSRAAGCRRARRPASTSTSAPPPTPTRSRPACRSTGVNPSPTAPTITISGAAIVHRGHALRVHRNPNSTTAANPELNGLRQIVGTGTFGGINPATAGNEFWQASSRDTSTTTFSLTWRSGFSAGSCRTAGRSAAWRSGRVVRAAAELLRAAAAEGAVPRRDEHAGR